MNRIHRFGPSISLFLVFLLAISAGCGDDPASLPVSVNSPDSKIELVSDSPGSSTDARTISVVGPAPEEISVFPMAEDLRIEWTSLLQGDYNVDGRVTGIDLFSLTAHYNETVDENPDNTCIDGNGDGVLNGLDLFLISVNFAARVDGYFVYMEDSADGGFDGEPVNSEPVAYTGCGGSASYTYTSAPFQYPFFAVRSYTELDGAESEASPAAATAVIPWAEDLNWQIDSAGLKLGWNTWNEVNGVLDHWRIEMREEGGDWEPFAGTFDVNTPDPQYGLILYDVDVELDGSVVDLRVTGEGADGAFGHLSTLDGVELSPVGDPPTELDAAAADGAVQLSWTESVSTGVTGYNVYRSTIQGGPYTRVPAPRSFGGEDVSIAHSGEGGVLFDDESLTNEETYYYVVRTLNDTHGESNATAEVMAVPSVPPAAPMNLVAVGFDNHIEIDWDENSEEDLAGYRVYRAIDVEGPFTERTYTTANSYQDSGVEPGETWHFHVRAVDENGVESEPSEVCSACLLKSWRRSYVDFQRAGAYCSLAIDSNDQPGISYRGVLEKELRYAHSNGSMYLIEEVDSDGDVGSYTSLAFDSLDNPAISYRDEDANVLKFAKYNGATWDIEVVDETGDTGGFGTSLAFDGAGNPLIAYYDKDGDDLRLAWHDGADFQISTLDADGDVGRYPSLALDESDLPAIAYLDNDSAVLKLVRFDGADWDLSVMNNADVAGTISLAFDSLGNPSAAHGRNGNYTYWDGGQWEHDGYEGADVTYHSLAFDQDGYPLIVYYLLQGSMLKYAWHDGEDWVTGLIDDDGVVGKYCSLAFDSTGTPIAAYYNGTYEDLYVASYY